MAGLRPLKKALPPSVCAIFTAVITCKPKQPYPAVASGGATQSLHHDLPVPDRVVEHIKLQVCMAKVLQFPPGSRVSFRRDGQGHTRPGGAMPLDKRVCSCNLTFSTSAKTPLPGQGKSVQTICGDVSRKQAKDKSGIFLTIHTAGQCQSHLPMGRVARLAQLTDNPLVSSSVANGYCGAGRCSNQTKGLLG